MNINSILYNADFTKEELIYLLSLEGDACKPLYKRAAEIRKQYVGNAVYLRGLIEYSNVCQKNCYYCGIRSGNSVQRYTLADEEVVAAAIYAYEHNFGSLVLQAGEIASPQWTQKITSLLTKIHKETNHSLGITLSLGEQNADTLKQWKNAGASRYLLRIETSNPDLYKKLHPNDHLHSFEKRLGCLDLLRSLDYQVGTGVMLGLPFQTIGDLADDLLFFKHNDIDMCGMGPYIPHKDTPLFQYENILLTPAQRIALSINMVAMLRIMMPDINIAATTALQTLDPLGREKAIAAGANVIMPNLSPISNRKDYLLYDNKACIDENAVQCLNCLKLRVEQAGCEIAFGEQGNSLHFSRFLKINDAPL